MPGLSRRWAVAVSLALALPAPAGEGNAAVSTDADRVVGLWKTGEEGDEGHAHVEIEKAHGEYTGTIVWLSKPNFPAGDSLGMGGQPKRDRGNPDPALRDRPIIGLKLLEGFRYTGELAWSGGTVYDPTRGKTYKCKLRLAEDGRLKVRGFIGFSLLGRTTQWTRVVFRPGDVLP